MYGIQETVYRKLMNYFQREGDIKQVTLFGSRAKNTARINSDIDLCITYSGTAKASVQEEIDELIGIYDCDVVFTDQVNEALNKQIERDGIVIYRVDS